MTKAVIVLCLAVLPCAFSQRRGTRQTTAPGAAVQSPVLLRSEGTLKSVTKKELRLVVEGEQILTFRITRKTTFSDGRQQVTASKIAPGTPVVLEAGRDMAGDLFAVRVTAKLVQ